MRLGRLPCASFGRFWLLVVEAAHTWACPSIEEGVSIIELIEAILLSYLLLFLIFVVPTLARTSHARLLISLVDLSVLLASPVSTTAYHLDRYALKTLWMVGLRESRVDARPVWSYR
jgi:hypothetical protein